MRNEIFIRRNDSFDKDLSVNQNFFKKFSKKNHRPTEKETSAKRDHALVFFVVAVHPSSPVNDLALFYPPRTTNSKKEKEPNRVIRMHTRRGTREISILIAYSGNEAESHGPVAASCIDWLQKSLNFLRRRDDKADISLVDGLVCIVTSSAAFNSVGQGEGRVCSV